MKNVLRPMTGKDRVRLSLLAALMLATFAVFMIQLESSPAGLAVLGEWTGVDLGPFTPENWLQDARLTEAWTNLCLAMAASMLLLPIHVAWIVRSSLWGKKTKVAWIMAVVLLNSLGMLLFAAWTTYRVARRYAPRPLKPRETARTARFLATREIDRESLTDGQFLHLGVRLRLRRQYRFAGVFLLFVLLAVLGMIAYAQQTTVTRVEDRELEGIGKLSALFSECECGEAQKVAESLDGEGYVLVHPDSVRLTYQVLVLFWTSFVFHATLLFAFTLFAFGNAAAETRNIDEFLHAIALDREKGET